MLDGTNYRNWTISVELSNGFDLLGYIEDPSISNETKTHDWQATDHCSRVIITQSITIEIRSEMCTMHTAQVMWDYLCGRFQQSSVMQTYVTSQAL